MTQSQRDHAEFRHSEWPDIKPSQFSNLKLLKDEVTCFRAKLNPNSPELLKTLIPQLSRDDKGRLISLRRIQDQNRFAFSRALLKQVLDGFGSSSSQLSFNRYGKPFLGDRAFEFNLSHSGNIILLALSCNIPVGVDVEKIVPDDDFDNFFQIFHPNEFSYFQSIAKQKNHTELMKFWTHKEAITKALGLGLQLDPSKIALEQSINSMALKILPPQYPQEWSLFTLYPCTNYMASLALPQPKYKLNTYTIDLF